MHQLNYICGKHIVTVTVQAKDNNNDDTILQQTRAETTITPTEPDNNDQGLPGILILAIGIALAVGIIATIVLVSVVVIKRRRERNRRAQENNISGKGKPGMPKER